MVRKVREISYFLEIRRSFSSHDVVDVRWIGWNTITSRNVTKQL